MLLLAARTASPSERTALAREADALGKKLEREAIVPSRAAGMSLRAAVALTLGDEQTARSMYHSALQLFESSDMRLHAAASRLAIASLEGGDEGRQLTESATQAFTEQGVRIPSKFAAVFVPQPMR
jgi:hypothetical protein